MKNWWQLTIILGKQYLMHHRIWLAVLLAAVILMRTTGYGREEEASYSGIMIGVCAEDEDGKALISDLQKEEGIFCFQVCEEEEELKRQVENGTLECGYVFPEGFYENLKKGRLHRQITLYYSPASAAHKISYEAVFSHLFEMLSDSVLENYLAQGNFEEKEREEMQARLTELKEQYETNGSTFSFVYEKVGEEEKKGEDTLNTARGLIAVFIFFMSLLGLGNSLGVTENVGQLPAFMTGKIKEISMDIGIMGSVLQGGLLLLFSGTGCGGAAGIMKEIYGLLFYFFLLEIYMRILRLFLRSPQRVYGMIPVLVLGSLLFSPVLIQIKAYLPAAAWVEKIFPASYYLNLFY